MYSEGKRPNVVISLSNDKILDRSKFKAFADDKFNEVQRKEFVIGMGKRENDDYQTFPIFP